MKRTPPQISSPFDKVDQHREKLNAIIVTAATLIQNKGVHGTSLDDVANALGVTKPSVYYYVKDKEELVYLCHQRILTFQAEAIDIAKAHVGTGAEKLEVLIRNYAKSVWDPSSGLPRLWQDAVLKPQRLAAIRKAYRVEADRIVDIFRLGMKDGSLQKHNPEIAERAVVGSILWVPIWYMPGNHEYDRDDLLEHIIRIFFNGLKAK